MKKFLKSPWTIGISTTLLGFILTVRSVYKELHADHETGAADNK